ncbi:MAG: protein kinase, partial [Candidatus Riflebacteria bacterium]|nr:protein kinase [Candidatus Riflebacteria bacterium]
MSSGEAQNVKYVPKRKIRAIGSFYSVYEATQVGLNRPVELRVLNFKQQPGSAEVARFKHEFSTLANLDHPNIIRVLDMGVMADHVFYVTDLRNSKSFQELFEKGRSFAVEEALSITRSLGQALSHLHKKNILHRDLTPSAVYLDQETSIAYMAIVGKLLKEKMDDRFQTAEDLLSDLDKATEKLDVKSVISEIAESTVTELKVPRPPPKLTDTLVKASRSRALEQAAGRPADETTQIRTEVVKKPSGAAAGTVDPMLWIRAHKEYLFMGGAPALLVLVLMVLFATRSDEPPPVPTST